MPLLDISANVAGLDSPSRKRTHEQFAGVKRPDMVQSKLSFAGAAVRSQNPPTDLSSSEAKPSMSAAASPAQSGSEPPAGNAGAPAITSPSATRTPSRPKSTPLVASGALTPAKASSITVSAAALAGSTPTKTSASPSSAEPPAKRKRLANSEKEEKAKAEELKRQQKEQEKAAKAAEKAKAEEEKKAKAEEAKKKKEEKEAKAEEARKKKEEKEAKAEEARKKKEEKEEEKERKRREKEEEQRKLQEAKEKKEQSQMRLGAFFTIGGSTANKTSSQPSGSTTSPAGTAQKTEGPGSSGPVETESDGLAEYRKVFKPFFVKENVKLARNAFELDEPARAAKTRALDSFVCGESTTDVQPFTGAACVDYFCLPSLPKPRGRPYPSVRKIISILSDASPGSATTPIKLDPDADVPQANSLATKGARELLKEVPMKYLFFFQDVRPAYYGTVSGTPPSSRSLHKLARNPISRDVLPLQYDYDSEAEWVDDGDGEDIDDLDDDDEDNADEDEDMADFLDDSEDVVKRPVFASGMEPESSGLCFEDSKRLGPSDQMYKFRMEFILDLDHHHSIDPFATHYWEPEAKAGPAPASLHPSAAASMKPPALASSTPTTPANAFAAISQGAAASAAAKKLPLVPPETVDAFKRAILKYPKLSKLGLVEILSSEFDKCTKAQVKNSVEAMAERSGTGHDKMWRLKPEFAF